MIPEPDYNDDNNDANKNNNGGSSVNAVRSSKSGSPNRNNCNATMPQFDDYGLVLPRKPQNPCLQSQERKSLHKEMLWNQKM